MHFSTVSRSDVYAVLMDLAGVLADYMAQGRSVKIDGLGTFYYTITAGGNGVDSPDKVNASQITGVRVRFIPEATRKSGAKLMVYRFCNNMLYFGMGKVGNFVF